MNNEGMIVCDRCGAVYKSSMRYCMKCGKLNYNHPDNASMLKYAGNDANNVTVYNSFDTNETNTPKMSFEEQFNYMIADKAGNKSTCVVVNIVLLIISIVLVSLILFAIKKNLASVFVSTEFLLAAVLLLLICLETISMQFIYMKANKPWWKQLIPFYNMYVFFDIAMKNSNKFFLTFIPLYGIYVGIKAVSDLGKKFGYTGWKTVVFAPIVLPMIAFNTAASYEGVYYVSDRKRIGQNVLEEDYRKNKSTLYIILSLIITCIIVLVFVNYQFFYSLYQKNKLLLSAKEILNLGIADIRDEAYICSNGKNLYSDEDTYYIPFGIMGFDLGDDFYDRYSDYKGYIKVVRNYKDEKYYIAIYNDKYGMAEVSQKDLRKNKVSIKEELITEVPQNTIVCHKN